MDRRNFCSAITALAALPARAQASWPWKTVKILVPGGTGSVTDIRARWLAARLSAVIGQHVVVENRAGAAGLIGMEAGARADADGHTLVVVHQGTMVVNPAIYARLPYDPARDFAPVTRLGIGALVLVVNPSLSAGSLAELLALARSRGTPLTFGTPGAGTPPHVAVELLKRLSGIDAIHVPYKSGGAAVSDLIAGHIDFEIEGLSVMLPHIQSGRVRALATTGEARVASLPQVPTMREAGLQDYVYQGWVGIAVPAATRPDVIASIYGALTRVLETNESREWFAAAGAVPGAIAPEAFAAAIRGEQAQLGRVIREAGIKAE